MDERISLPISKVEARSYDRVKHEEDLIVNSCNSLIKIINGIITTEYDDIKRMSNSAYPFEIFQWKPIKDFDEIKESVRNKITDKIREVYLKEGIEVTIYVEYNFRRLKIKFLNDET